MVSDPIDSLHRDSQNQSPVAELDAEETAFQLRKIVDNLPIVLWCIDTEGVFTFAEGKGLKALGTTPRDVIGRSAFAIYKDNAVITTNLRRSLQGEEFFETVHTGPLAFETLYSPIKTVDGRVIGASGLALDVTSRLRVEEERSALQDRLLQLQKAESLGVLTGGIAHDFNNLLTAIIGNSLAALSSLPPASQAAGDIRNVVAAANRGALLTRQLFAYAGLGKSTIAAVDLAQNVRELVDLLAQTFAKEVSLQLNLTQVPFLTLDLAQLQQVAMNLVINGVESMKAQGGTLSISTGVADFHAPEGSVVVGSQRVTKGPAVFLKVADQGCGIDEATRVRIFEPFFSTKPTGRGLGLSAVLGFVRSHEAALTLETTPNTGSAFTIWFPTP